MEYQGQLTVDAILKLEKGKQSSKAQLINRGICALPLIAAALYILMYKFYPNHNDVVSGNYAPTLIGITAVWIAIRFVRGFFSEEQFTKLREKAALYTAVYLMLTLYDFLTLKTATLPLPFFTWPDLILKAMIEDRAMLLNSAYHSLILLFTGYFAGGLAGTISGIAAGSSKKVDYWISPIMRVLGPIPSTTWVPVVLILAPTLFQGSVFLIALGVWYPTTLASYTGISNIRKSYFEAAKTLGAPKPKLITKISIPAALPNILQGWTQGMSVACTVLMVAEMLGVDAGLGWYINWQKGWAEYAKVYAAIIVICVMFFSVTRLLAIIKDKLLHWQKGEVDQ